MPKKPNKAGNPQEYIPAGNGDQSGEYADESGSNKHFTSFKKPENQEDESMVVKNKEEVSDTIESFNNYISETFRDDQKEFGERIIVSFSSGNDGSKKLVSDLIKDGIEIKRAEGIANYNYSVNLAFYDVGMESPYHYHSEGDTFYHEFFHAMDDLYSKGIINKKTGEIILKGLLNKEDIEHISHGDNSKRNKPNWRELSKNLSTCKVLSNGKTLHETLKEECKRLANKKAGLISWDSIQNDFKDELEKLIEEKYPNHKDVIPKIVEIENKVLEQLKNVYKLNYFSDSFQDKRNELLNKDKNYQALEKTRLEISKYKNQKIFELSKAWMPISDMFGIHKKVPYGFCGGHKGNYGEKPGIIALEFFAEYGSAKSRNSEYSKKGLALFHKYFPETSKMGDELYNMIIEHNKKRKKI